MLLLQRLQLRMQRLTTHAAVPALPPDSRDGRAVLGVIMMI
jgi:hypothetical protein